MPAAPYDLLNVVINTARVRLNDVIKTLAPVSGKVLDSEQPFTQQSVNSAWRRLQEFLANMGYTKLQQETVLMALAGAVNTDPAVQAFVDWTGYNNGTTLDVTKALPQDAISPCYLWERANGGSSPNFLDMDQDLNGLPAITKDFLNHRWEWRNDQIILPGATALTDLRIRYYSYLVDFVDNSPTASTPWYNQPVPIMRSLNAFAYYICYEFASARTDGSAGDAGQFQMMAEEAAVKIVDRDLRRPRSLAKVSEAAKMRDKFTREEVPQAGSSKG